MINTIIHYKCGINGTLLLRELSNYEHFLQLYEKYIGLITETFAWCLKGNHFHLPGRIKEKADIAASTSKWKVRIK